MGGTLPWGDQYDLQLFNISIKMSKRSISLDQAIEEVSADRGRMGAFQKNNLESNLNYLRIAHENAVSSESVIRDADMAEEMAKFTRDQIMVEASTSMLAQANQNSMAVLKLLQ